MEIYKLYKKTQRTVWEVSNYGNVKMNGALHECCINSSGYKLLANGKCLHKVVAKLFIPNPEDKPQVDHIDTNKLNNHVDNLRWCTHKENQNNPKTKQNMCEAQKGEKNAMSKKCVYNNIEFGSIAEAWRYAVKCDGYDKSLITFYKHIKG